MDKTTTYTARFILDYAVISTHPVMSGEGHSEESVIAFAISELIHNHAINLEEIGYQEAEVLDANGDEIEVDA
jgi:hypothetical protein